MIKYIVKRSKKNRQWYATPVARNGKKILKEGYTRKRGALNAVRLVKASAGAKVEVIE